MVEAHKYALRMSGRTAERIVAAFAVGNEVLNPHEHGPEVMKVFEQCPEGMAAIGWAPLGNDRADGSVNNTRRGAGSASIEGRAATLREKGRRWRQDPERRKWLDAMTIAFAFTLMPWVPITRASVGAFLAAQQVGEQQVAVTVIFPMLELAHGRAIPAPDFSTIYPSKT